MPKLKSYTVSLAYKVPLNLEIDVEALNEDEAILKAIDLKEQGRGRFSDTLDGGEEPDYKLNKKSPYLKSVGIDVL